MQRPALRSVTRTAVPARPTPPSTVPLSFRTRPSPSSAPPSKHRHYASAACPPPLAHPTRPHAPVQATTPNKRYGQPLPSTHPHLLAPGQLTPGISATEYETRRRKLVDRLDDDAVVVIAGGRTVYSSQNIFYRFRQRSNFWYLTGFEEPDSALIIEKDSSAKGYKMTLFCQPKEPYDELWNGARTGLDGARDIFGADEAVDAHLFPRRLSHLLSSKPDSPIYIDLPSVSPATFSRTRQRPAKSRSLLDYLARSGTSAKHHDEVDEVLGALQRRDVRSAAGEVERLRLIKSEAEVKVMRRAADASSAAHAKVMRFARPGMTEHHLTAHFAYHASLRGAAREAYVPVCAAGKQALTIHYLDNNRPVREGELVLLDAGCELGGYASDITRVFPASGTFSTAQAHLYEAVLRVEKACVALCTSRADLSLEEMHRVSVDLTRTELRDLGFSLRGGDLERVLYPHFLTHPLGVDLHDTMSFSRNEKIQEGMVITIEPGIYVPPLAHFPKGFHNLVVRIEDEVVVGAEEPTVLSVNAPKELVDVEACCQGLLEGVGRPREVWEEQDEDGR
ncbi:peptidase M24 [Rhodotorula diobovata]|uniref:Peptidase M24 n=1 Tax=Rhodotorula diobovata TaxID=5288 RepID=A0A5C5G0M8_9BASI|nr:peptidase M24 [Rhodotorula diobovata]